MVRRKTSTHDNLTRVMIPSSAVYASPITPSMPDRTCIPTNPISDLQDDRSQIRC